MLGPTGSTVNYSNWCPQNEIIFNFCLVIWIPQAVARCFMQRAIFLTLFYFPQARPELCTDLIS